MTSATEYWDGYALTDQEVTILKASLAMTSPEISAVTGLAPQSIKNIRCGAYRKLDVSGPNALWQAAQKMGWITFRFEMPLADLP